VGRSAHACAYRCLLAANQSAPSNPDGLGHSAWVFATVEHSEWCPAGNVRLDLQTGRYAFTAGAPHSICHGAGLERPVTTGRLAADRLAAIRAAAARARTEGFVHPSCRGGPRRDEIVVNNAGRPILVLTNGAGTASAPEMWSCWSTAASALYALLDDTFRSVQRR
jgi:hypothetical protein